jgi:hypothetical protein
MYEMRRAILLLAFDVISFPMRGQTVEFPAPTGPYKIGRIGFDWVDASRPDHNSHDPSAHREMMVYFWYPAAKSHTAVPTAYLPGARQFESMPEVQARFRRSYGEHAARLMLSGSLHTHALDGAPIAKSAKPFPLIIFSHGAGSNGFNYTALIEDVVSHGYVVAAIEHTYAAKAVLFPDGRVVQIFNETAPAGLSAEERAKWRGSRITEGINEGAADVRFVLDRVIALNRDPAHFLLAGRVDPMRAAPMGHSAGAEFSARACQIDARFKACVDLDGGMVPVAALPIAPDGARMKPPLLFLEAYHPESTMGGVPHETIAAYYKTREEQLEDCPQGTFAVVLRSPGIAHASFTDIALLLAGEPDPQALPQVIRYPERSAALHNLDLIRRFVRDFLARNLKGEKAPLLESDPSPLHEATVQPYGR